jgi:hypothetical protein
MARRDPFEQIAHEAAQVLHGPKRDRDWEARQRKRGIVATYRGIPAELQERIKKIAAEHHLNIGELARRFLEYGAAAYDAGELELKPTLSEGKVTLYPSGGGLDEICSGQGAL